MLTCLTALGDPVTTGQLRPPSVPLVTCDPYFSIWSANDRLTDGPTRHWTGKPQPLTSLVRIDGQTFRLMGDEPRDLPAAQQASLTVLPTRTIYDFDAAGVRVTVTFTTALLPDDLMVCSRPITYINWEAKSSDGKSHEVAVYLDASSLLAVNVPEQTVKAERGRAGELTTLRVGSTDQPVLETRGDDVRIDWGYFYLASNTKSAAIASAAAARNAFVKQGALPGADDTAFAKPVLSMSFALGKVSETPASAHALLAYDDIKSIRYFNDDLIAYWRKDGATISDLLQTAEKDFAAITKRCDEFDSELIADLRRTGGDSYVQLGALAWRQALAAQKICADANGQPLMFSKENFSNGCIGTVDVLYPAAPQMLAFNPTMLKASLVPLMDYSASPRWKWDSAPHDLGTYPQATGQVYGDIRKEAAMPVEECGNLLILHAALAKVTGSAEFSRKYWPTLTKWVVYLKDKGLDPENQLCTDDFAGHIARNANLSAKAIMGIASYAMLADMLGHKDVAAEHMKIARDYAAKWMDLGDDGDHYKLVFGDNGNETWSQKYNFVWDKLLGFNILPPHVEARELAYYRKKLNRYGLPLDSRKSYTKIDWELWTATWASKREDFQAIVDACAKWLSETPSRVPMSDWYETDSGKQSGFQARSVVGGLFIPFLRDETIWKKYVSRDKTQLSGWAPPDFSTPEIKTVVAAADTEPAEWKYTTKQPPARWMAADFNDRNWSVGKGGFGVSQTPGSRVNTVWNSPEIYLRRQFTLPEGDLHDLRLFVHHDEDTEIYLNGVLAAKKRGFLTEYQTLTIAPAARATLKPGRNVMAIHCRQTVGGQYIDAGLVQLVKPAPAKPAAAIVPSNLDRPQAEERLSFQAGDSWNGRVNLNADVAMAYGIDESLPQRLASWKERGYTPHVMTGVSWGEYQDYYYGRWDGKNHVDEAQMQKNGEMIGHGKDVYYMCPSEDFARFLCVGVKRALDAGAEAIHLEEPEIWVRSGWEEGFKREWQSHYGEPWMPPDSSPDAQYRASKLKYFLYRRALGQVFDFVKQYGKEHNRDIKCYVPTHSMINYANWGIVSPESSLLEVGCDGYIAQVWTGTARTPNYYEGVKKERTFETAFLEYGAMQNLVRASGRRVWYLNDPIEDNANHSWHDYRTNWESTLVASLLQPEVWHYEIMPWPHRIFQSNYPSEQPVKRDTPRIPIPKEYETELQAVITAMGDMKQPPEKVQWLSAGTSGVGVLVADTMMFQRFGPGASDPEFGSFYGLALPLLMRGIPVEAVQIETADLAPYKVLLLTYEGQKPPQPKLHPAIAKWVNDGGALVVIDDDKDPYHKVREWWNSGDEKLATPRHDLFDKLGIARDAIGLTKVGKGAVVYAATSPAALSKSRDGADKVRDWTKQAMNATGAQWKEADSLVLRRGPYIVAGGLEERRGGSPLTLRGRFIPLFDAAMPVVSEYTVKPGSRALLVDLDAMPATGVVAAACRTRGMQVSSDRIEFHADGIANSRGLVCMKIPAAPKSVTLDDAPMSSDSYEYRDGLLRVRLANGPDPQHVIVNW